MRVAVKVAYNGQFFHGFARQPTVPTVEGTILNILHEKEILTDPSSFRYSSRTDKGVSALGNVIAFSTSHDFYDTQKILFQKYNHLFFYGIQPVDDNFFPRYARLRQYRYYLPYTTLPKEELLTILSVFTGEHDFSNFARIEQGKNPVRSIDNILVTENKSFIIIDFFAQTFLWHQLRRIIGAVLSLAQGKHSYEDITQALVQPTQPLDLGMASACNLVLYDVVYDFSFDISSERKKTLKKFERQLISQMLSPKL